MSFQDVVNNPPEIPAEPAFPQNVFLPLINAALGVLLVLVAVNAFSLLLAGKMTALIGISTVFLCLSMPAAILYFHQFHQANRAVSQHRELKKYNQQLREKIEEFAEKYQGLSKNFDSLLQDYKEEYLESLLSRENEARNKQELYHEREAVIDRLGKRFLDDSMKWISGKLTVNNFAASKERLLKVIQFCRKHQYEVPAEFEEYLLQELKTAYELVVKRDLEKQEQARIKAQIREEKQAEQEKQKALERIEAEKKAIQEALDSALRETHEEHNAVVDALRAQLAEAEERSQRAISQAQLTKSGHVYVISNHGSFGDNVFKIGMTRRLEPLDRVKELGDASVPFPFDVHMMISCDDAPKLEYVLHSKLHQSRLNKVNLRKEYFRADIHTIAEIVKEHHGVVEYIADPEAFEYRESLNMSTEDFEFITEAVGIGASVGEDEDE